MSNHLSAIEITRARPQASVPTNPAETASLVILLLSISKSTRAFIALLLAEIGLHPGQDQLLSRLEPGCPVSVSELADQLSVRPSTVSKMLDRLIEKELVLRAASNGDARRTMVELTAEGEKAQEEVRRLWQRLEAELHSSLPSEEAEGLTAALSQIDGLLKTRLRRLR